MTYKFWSNSGATCPSTNNGLFTRIIELGNLDREFFVNEGSFFKTSCHK